MTTLRHAAGWSGALAALLVVTVVVSAGVGSVRVPPGAVVGAVVNELPWGAVEVPETAATIVVDIRLPRIALGATVGAGLALAGAVMQGFFRNPLADPSIVGVSSGAAVGAVAAIAVPSLVPLGLQPMAFLTGLATAFAVYGMATRNGRTPVATLLLAGVAVQTFLGAVISYLLLHSGESLERAVYWLMGHLHASTWAEVRFALPVVLAAALVLMAYARDLNVLLLGEEEANHLGVEVERTKRVLLALATVATAAGVAVAGVIGFVGLVVPHVMRLLVGPDHRVLLPTSTLGGAAFLVAADTVARSGSAAEVPVGIVTAAVGAPFFLYLLLRREVHGL